MTSYTFLLKTTKLGPNELRETNAIVTFTDYGSVVAVALVAPLLGSSLGSQQAVQLPTGKTRTEKDLV